MRALQLDFQRAPPPVTLRGATVLAVSIVAAVATASHGFAVHRELAQAQQAIAALEQASSQSRPRASDKALRAQRDEATKANLVLRQLHAPWDALFRAIERSGGARVALLAIEPDLRSHTVRISGEAKDFGAVVAYAAELGARPPLGPVVLQSHEQQSAGKPVRFTLVAAWREAPR